MRGTIATFLTLLALLLLGAAPASAAPGVVQDLPGCRANVLDRNDDGSTNLVPLGFTAHLFNTTYDEAFVNNNGNITFDEDLSQFTPFDFRETGQPIIAPFFADVDTNGNGSGLVHYGTVANFAGAKAFCVIWDNVGYFASHDDRLNRFQLLLVDRGTVGVDIIFNYDSITWETGDASDGQNGFGGTSAAAGFAAGDGDSAHALLFPGSFANGGLLDSNAGTSLAGHASVGQPAGRWLFELRAAPPTGGRLTGIVRTPLGDEVGQAPVQMCRQGGACVTRLTNSAGRYTASNIPSGTYTVTGFPGPGSNLSSTTVSGVIVRGPADPDTVQDITLGPAPSPPPPGTDITNIGHNADGIPVAYWGDPLELTTQGCAGAVATYQVILHGRIVRTGSLSETSAGTYRTTIAPLAPESGDGEIDITLDCPGPTVEEIDFGIYIDPSGHVRNTNGNPVEGATVVLYRSAVPQGPFFPVPDGSAVMSPSNRSNPDLSRADGRFGWDVVAGYYVVTAQKDGCVSAADASRPDAVSRVMTIPPPVTDLDLRLNCGESPPVTQPPAATPQVVVKGTTASNPPPRALLAITSGRLVRGRTLAVKIACASIAKAACAGAVKVKIGKKAVGAKTFKNLKPGKAVVVKIALTRKGRALVSKVKRGKKVKFAIAASVRDAAGAGATSTRTLSVRR
jgi:hypothetical protein